jgi:putrescine transport system permease protein
VKDRSTPLLVAMGLGFAFLYAPLVLVVAYSFNDSRLVTVWGGFSLRWYAELLRSPDVLDAALLSLRIAVISASVATALGTLAGFALARLGRFRGRVLFTGMITAPLVMPEVITGLSLLLLFVTLQQWVGWPAGRGAGTITIAHVTFCTAYVAIVVRSRLSNLEESLEEAALDLGGRPLRVHFDITLPIVFPAILAGWLLSFTLSLDDLVIASFVSGPGSTTLPMLIFSKVRLGVTPDVNALAAIVIALVSIAVATATWTTRRREARRTRDRERRAAI